MSREIMQQALDALRRVGQYGDIYRYKNTEQSPYTQIYEAIDAINVELSKPDEKPEWQELYKDEVFAILAGDDEWSSLEFAQAISDLLKEKNT
jgi:hypothetical protein